MSYEPKILIDFDDLEENEGVITTLACHQQASEAMIYVEKLLKYRPVEINEHKYILCQPELSGFSKKVTDLLRDFKIEYALFD